VSGAPFWSPDSRFIAYTDNNAQLNRIDPSGGPPEMITTSPSFAGGSWSEANVILYASPTQGIMQVSSTGGSPMALTTVDAARKETSHTGPWFLPGGRRFLYLRSSTDAVHAGIYVGELDSPPDKQSLTRILATEQNAMYAPSSSGGGHLLFMRDRTLFAQTFDPATLTLSGESTRIADDIGTGAGNTVSYGFFTTSNTGVVAYRRGQSTTGSAVWVSRSGQEAGAITPSLERPANPRLSPDGKRLAITTTNDLWVYDVGGRPPIKLTSGGFSFSPLWSPDGRQLAFEQGTLSVGIPADGSSLTPEPMSPAQGHFHPFAWSRDGAELILIALPGPTKTVDILRYSIAKKSVEAFLATSDNEGGAGASLSPDGRWLAYVSTQTGRPEIWVRPYPASRAPVRISPNGGFEPTWSRDGRELYYREQTRLMVVPVNLSGGFNFKPATTLFESRYLHTSQPPTYDVAADGRFVMIKPADAAVAPFNVVVNWEGVR
jgi:Tol biopolymer transport system component